MTSQELREKQRKYLWSNHILYDTDPIALDLGEGLTVWDADVDLVVGILVRTLAEIHETLGVN